jgi:hypothetical protein
MKKQLVVSIVVAAALAVSFAVGCAQSAPPEEGEAAGAQATSDSGIPRTADGHPDITGVWSMRGVENITDNLAPGSEIVHTPFGEEEFKKVDQALDPNARCLPWGPTRMMCCTVMPNMFVVHKDVIAILTESQQTFRLIYMDGRPLPEDLYDAEGNVDPQVGGWMGFSLGRWDGDTLRVETVGADTRTWVDGHAGHQHSDKMKLTETFNMKDANTIEYMATIDDPVHYQKPWSFVKSYTRMPAGDRILSHSCLENEKDLEYMQVGAIVGGGGR